VSPALQHLQGHVAAVLGDAQAGQYITSQLPAALLNLGAPAALVRVIAYVVGLAQSPVQQLPGGHTVMQELAQRMPAGDSDLLMKVLHVVADDKVVASWLEAIMKSMAQGEVLHQQVQQQLKLQGAGQAAAGPGQQQQQQVAANGQAAPLTAPAAPTAAAAAAAAGPGGPPQQPQPPQQQQQQHGLLRAPTTPPTVSGKGWAMWGPAWPMGRPGKPPSNTDMLRLFMVATAADVLPVLAGPGGRSAWDNQERAQVASSGPDAGKLTGTMGWVATVM
jgi:hypothetical protein